VCSRIRCENANEFQKCMRALPAHRILRSDLRFDRSHLGDSGQTGSSTNCRMAGQIASPKRRGQPSFVPRICSMPSTWETRRPTVTASWFTVPRPPLRFNGAISDMYMGTNEVFKPQLTPMMNRPKNSIS